MFSTAGYLKGLNCPFFISGLCERPYCHFRHSKSEPEEGKVQKSASNSVYIDSLVDKPWSSNSSIQSDVVNSKKVEGDSLKDTPRNIIGYNKYTGDPIYEDFKQETYEVEGPSNNDSASFNKYTGKPVYNGSNTTSIINNIPEYNPTPIAELKKSNLDKTSVIDHSQIENLNQYDPEKNFSTHQVTASHSLPSAPKRILSYEPTNIRPAKLARKTSYEFDISKFSSGSEESENEKDKIEEQYSPTESSSYLENYDKDIIAEQKLTVPVNENEKEELLSVDTNVMKDVKYFENLLLSNPEESSFDDLQKSRTICLNKEDGSVEERLVNKKIATPEKKEKKSGNKSLTESLKLTKKNSDSSIHKKSDSSHKDTGKHSLSKSHKSRSSSQKSHSSQKASKGDESSDQKLKSKSAEKIVESDRKPSSNRSSSKNKSESKHTKEQPNSNRKVSGHSDGKSKDSKLHVSKVKNHSSKSHKDHHSSKSHKDNQSCKNSLANSHDKSKKSDERNSGKNSHQKETSDVPQRKLADISKQPTVKRRSDEQKSKFSSTGSMKSEVPCKVTTQRASSDSKHIVDINVDLFGEDSDKEILDDSDLEHHPLIHAEDLSDNDTYDECLQIFKASEHSNTKHNLKKTLPETTKNEEPMIISSKKRVAHSANSKEVKRKIREKPYSKLSPAQVMHNRFLEMRKKALEEAAKLHSASTSLSSSSSSLHQPTLSNNKSKGDHKQQSSSSNSRITVVSTASKTKKRQARIPDVSNLARPQIPAEFGSKVPTNIRQRYLNLIIDECLKLCDSEEEAFKRGQEEEMVVYKRSNTKTIYLNVAINAIKRLRNEISESLPTTSKLPRMNAMQLSHEAILGGKNAMKTSYTVKRSGTTSKLENFKVHEKICVRCGKKFIVYPTGKYAKQEECIYHWAKAWKRKVNGIFDSRYNCCQGDFNSDGCQVAKSHVHDTNKWENLSGYMKTQPCSPPVDGDYGVFALDCEMVYTTAGVELARISVCDHDSTAVYESFVKPDNEIVDLNTRFSGITEDDLEEVTTSLRDVQAVLLSLVTDKTILMGHSLESDLTAVKITHGTVVDTSLVFPHRLGKPYKRALRTLMAEYLQKIIQDDVGGHDSMEDAASCLELMHMKLKEDARKER
ncbi:RNA exonuclease 1 homolog isoform X2 [Mytilus californianus]|uniref:RNA exonuclease 1 homolog isoform X2 n=1 Tax=Mytilus californianus TaxID=6549 RepID=UPI0022482BFC|nr:RNA exonuclease 1 homolog isoform X2 [Mytilus californianus]